MPLHETTLPLLAPRIVELPDERVIVTRGVGEPAEQARTLLPRLYRALHELREVRAREARPFAARPLRARWPNAHVAPRSEWVGAWALPVPADVVRVDGVALETWPYGLAAEVLHSGRFATEHETLLRLHEFARAQGYELVGPHEEEYLTPPGSRRPRMIVRYRIARPDEDGGR